MSRSNSGTGRRNGITVIGSDPPRKSSGALAGDGFLCGAGCGHGKKMEFLLGEQECV